MTTTYLKEKRKPFIKAVLTTVRSAVTGMWNNIWDDGMSDILLALCAGWRSVALVDFVLDAGAKGLIAISRQQSSWPGQQAKVVKERVPLLNAILQEETVTQSVVA